MIPALFALVIIEVALWMSDPVAGASSVFCGLAIVAICWHKDRLGKGRPVSLFDRVAPYRVEVAYVTSYAYPVHVIDLIPVEHPESIVGRVLASSR